MRQSWQSPAALITQLHSRETALVAHYWAMRSGGYGLSERHACRHGTHETSLCEHSKARLEDLDALRAKYVGCDRLAKDQVRKAGERRRGGRMSMTWRRLEAETCRSSNAKRLSSRRMFATNMRHCTNTDEISNIRSRRPHAAGTYSSLALFIVIMATETHAS